MSQIKILSPEIANQIAADEVVERPVSVVKELVENGLDAGAASIEIHLKNGGKTLIQVKDNGTGMSPQDAQNCVKRHATSKINNIDDLFTIQSFGFRGEALAAISSVSRFALITKTQNQETGTQIQIGHSSEPITQTVAASVGTTIRIEDLFYNTPARLQYLSKDETEYRHTLTLIQELSLSHPTVTWRLFHNDQEKIFFPAATDEQDRFCQITKKNTQDCLKIEQTFRDWTLTGIIGQPGTGIPHKKHQYLAINGRVIKDYRIAHAVREAYHQTCGIEKHLQPWYYLSLQMDPILVDVNVHPRKTEVKFSEPQDVYAGVKHAVMTKLQSLNISVSVPNNQSQDNSSHQEAKSPLSPLTRGRHGNNDRSSFEKVENFNQQLFSPSNSFSSFGERYDRSISSSLNLRGDLEGIEPQLISREANKNETKTDLPSSFTLIGQLHNQYILAQSMDGLWIFDQHALHERQRFERFWNEYQNAEKKWQSLLVPLQINLTQLQVSVLAEHAAKLENLGVKGQVLDKAYHITSVWTLYGKKDLEKIFEQLLEHLETYDAAENPADQIVRKLLEYKACRGSVMFGDTMQPAEMQKLLDDFVTGRWQHLCPHGRPNYWLISAIDLEKKFHR